MRMLACLLLVSSLVACQRADSAQRSAEITANAPEPVSRATPAPAVAVAPTAKSSCGCSGGGSCSGSCGGSCGGGTTPQWAAVPDKNAWTALQVTGMRCGGCGKKIERALANVDGVLAVKTDHKNARVEVATKPGVDARALVKPTIDGLGYQVH